ncbi:MAG: DUF1834 family protein [Chromatiales bacterium]|nr:DUF1834 family protein [Chromatiales bacterium]
MMQAEQLIVARLEQMLAKLTPTPSVLTAPDLAGVTEAQQNAPAVYVIYGGLNISQDEADGTIVEIQLTWHTVVVTRNVRSLKSGDGVRADAGPILNAVFTALTGWKPGADIRRLKPVNPPRPGYIKGYGYFPLSWSQRMQMRAAT